MQQPPVPTVRVVDSNTSTVKLNIIEGGGNAKVALWPGNGALYRSFQVIDLSPGSATIALSHASDCVYYVIEGQGAIIDAASLEEVPLTEGAMVHIDRGDGYRLKAAPSQGLKLLGGPCPPDPALYDYIQAGGA
jgi:mannose-6-phosphate isomerase-like protein (cupin superfamily)